MSASSAVGGGCRTKSPPRTTRTGRRSVPDTFRERVWALIQAPQQSTAYDLCSEGRGAPTPPRTFTRHETRQAWRPHERVRYFGGGGGGGAPAFLERGHTSAVGRTSGTVCTDPPIRNTCLGHMGQPDGGLGGGGGSSTNVGEQPTPDRRPLDTVWHRQGAAGDGRSATANAVRRATDGGWGWSTAMKEESTAVGEQPPPQCSTAMGGCSRAGGRGPPSPSSAPPRPQPDLNPPHPVHCDIVGHS